MPCSSNMLTNASSSKGTIILACSSGERGEILDRPSQSSWLLYGFAKSEEYGFAWDAGESLYGEMVVVASAGCIPLRALEGIETL